MYAACAGETCFNKDWRNKQRNKAIINNITVNNIDDDESLSLQSSDRDIK